MLVTKRTVEAIQRLVDRYVRSDGYPVRWITVAVVIP